MKKLFIWLTALLLPFALIFIVLRLMLTPLFIQAEYRLPWFPPDPYGFSQADRLHWAPYALDYLTNDADIHYLADLHFPDGQPLFNERELSHMEDVKRVVAGGLLAGESALGLIILLGLVAWRTRRGADFRAGLRRGGWLTIFLTLFSALFGTLSFSKFFTAFHALFFEGDSWLFYYSDTLIRLFPIRFWEDAFLVTGALLIGISLLLIFGWKPTRPGGVKKGEQSSANRSGV